MKTVLFFLLGLICGVLVVITARFVQLHFNQKTPFVPQPIEFHFRPPTSAQTLQVIEVENDVSKVPLEATASANLKISDQVLEGETVTTGPDSKATLQLGKALISSMSANTTLNFESTLSASLLVKQNQGSVIYDSQSVQPLSIRTLHFLIKLQTGNISVTTDPNKNTVTVLLNTGTAQVAWEDPDSDSQLQTLSAGQIYLFDDATLSFKIIH